MNSLQGFESTLNIDDSQDTDDSTQDDDDKDSQEIRSSQEMDDDTSVCIASGMIKKVNQY